MKLFRLSILAAALVVANCLNASQTPNCGDSLNGPLTVGMDLTPSGAGAPWESVSNGVVVGFDVQVICQVAAYLGYTGVQIFNIAAANFNAAIANGTVAAIISGPNSAITLPTPSYISYVKYNDSVLNQAAGGYGIIINANCCQLYANVALAISTIAGNGQLAKLRTTFNVTPNSYTPLSGLVPTACASTTGAFPARNAITNFILTTFCLGTCSPAAPTVVTVP